MFPQAYSLYPFLSPRSIPWTLNVSGAFRVRKVGDWLRVHGAEEVERLRQKKDEMNLKSMFSGGAMPSYSGLEETGNFDPPSPS